MPKEVKFSDVAMVDNAMEAGTLMGAAIAGLAFAALGAVLWVGFTVASGQHAEYMVLGMGVLVGLAVRIAGGGTTWIFGLLGVALTLLGSLASEYGVVILAATGREFDFYGVMTHLDFVQMGESLLEKASMGTYVFYAVALLTAYVLAENKIVKN